MSKLNTNSNTYTIAYAMVLVVVVAFLLAFVATALKDRQDANVQLDYKKQILNSLNLRNLPDAEATYAQVVQQKEMVAVGSKMENGIAVPDTIFAYTCNVNGEIKYVLPVTGAGLWGPISGFIALNDDKNTVFGAYFNHEGETAGLGAEIKDSKEWQEKFQGKKIFREGSDQIALGVKKKVEDPECEVDAVTGATLTSDGVDAMLREGLTGYIEFLKK